MSDLEEYREEGGYTCPMCGVWFVATPNEARAFRRHLLISHAEDFAMCERCDALFEDPGDDFLCAACAANNEGRVVL